MNISDPKQQIQDYLAGQMSPEEEKQFDSWLKQNPEGQKLFKQSAKDYQAIRWAGQWDKPDEKQAYAQLQQRLHKHRLYSGLWKYAALFFLLLGCGIFFWQRHIPQPLPLASVESRANHKFPTLTLSNGQQVLLADTLQIISGSSSKVNILQHDSGSLSYTPIRDTVPIKITYHTLTVPKGCEFSLTLSDGSRVWLNAGSKLKYPEVFAGDHREVYLEGEAYFEVARNTSHPFVVDMNRMEIEVLGTTFDARYERASGIAETTLNSGSICVRTSRSQQSVRLRPDERLVFNETTGSMIIEQVNASNYNSWIQPNLTFFDMTLEDIITNLERWFNVPIGTDASVDRTIRLSFHVRHESLEETLQVISLITGLQYTLDGESATFHTARTTRSR